MRSIHDLAAALRRLVKSLSFPSDEERAAAYVEGAGDRIDLEMRMREIDRDHLQRR